MLAIFLRKGLLNPNISTKKTITTKLMTTAVTPPIRKRIFEEFNKLEIIAKH
jgi:hypothetical protein